MKETMLDAGCWMGLPDSDEGNDTGFWDAGYWMGLRRSDSDEGNDAGFWMLDEDCGDLIVTNSLKFL